MHPVNLSKYIVKKPQKVQFKSIIQLGKNGLANSFFAKETEGF